MTNLDWIDEVLKDYNGYDFCGEKNCAGQQKANDIKQAITAHIEKEILRGRIEELEKLDAFKPEVGAYLSDIIDERLKTLNSQIGAEE